MSNFIKKIKENKSFIVPWLILGVSIIIFGSGLTYAYFDFMLNSQDASSLKVTGTDFDLFFDGTPIAVSSMYPVFDEYADTEANSFDFEIENNSRKLSACYDLLLNVDSISAELVSGDFKWKLLDSLNNTLSSGDFSEAVVGVDFLLKDDITIGAHSTDNLKLKIWLSSTESNQNNTQNKSMSATIKLNALGGTCSSIRVNTKLDDVRYIKDCVNGNTTNTINAWNEIKAMYNGINVAKGKIPTSTGTIQTGATYSFSNITDGDPTTANGNAPIVESGLQCVTVDLGQAYDLDTINVWHYWIDGRTYYSNTTYTSSDNSTWLPVIANVNAETSSGKSVSAYSPSSVSNSIYKVTNMVVNGSFENGTTGWAALNFTMNRSTVQKKHGSYSMPIATPNASHAQISQYVTIVSNNKYYGKISALKTTTLASAGQYDIIGFTGGLEMDFANVDNTTIASANQWYSLSGIVNGVENKASAELRLFTLSQISIYSDSYFMIDLTSTFGAGNEPSKAWCDANLDYFDGSQTYSFSLE